MVLAQYTIRSKQDYIFQTDRMVEITGASKLISEIWDELFRIATEKNFAVIKESGEKFDFSKINEIAEANSNTIVELFRGGGNLTVLFDSRDSFVALNKSFSFFVLKERPGMIPMAVCTECTGNYKEDYKSLMKESEIEKNRMNPGRDHFILPFSKVDRDTYIPITGVGKEAYDADGALLSCESSNKRIRGSKERKIKQLDELDRLIAIVHADGNNMGMKIQKLLGDDTDYETCVSKMRQFTQTTARAFSKDALEDCYRKLVSEDIRNKGEAVYRLIVADGDDLTFICNAGYAMKYTEAYLAAVDSFEAEFKYSACAGICIFRNSFPFSKAYMIAEQTCENAKQMVHVKSEETPDEGWVDFHIIRSGSGGNLERIREDGRIKDAMARPWLVTGCPDRERHIQHLKEVQRTMKYKKVPSGTIKKLGALWESSRTTFKQSFIRICGNYPGLKSELKKEIASEDRLFKTIYDISEVCDLWFQEEQNGSTEDYTAL